MPDNDPRCFTCLLCLQTPCPKQTALVVLPSSSFLSSSSTSSSHIRRADILPFGPRTSSFSTLDLPCASSEIAVSLPIRSPPRRRSAHRISPHSLLAPRSSPLLSSPLLSSLSRVSFFSHSFPLPLPLHFPPHFPTPHNRERSLAPAHLPSPPPFSSYRPITCTWSLVLLHTSLRCDRPFALSSPPPFHSAHCIPHRSISNDSPRPF
jgi:hypothetical protein